MLFRSQPRQESLAGGVGTREPVARPVRVPESSSFPGPRADLCCCALRPLQSPNISPHLPISPQSSPQFPTARSRSQEIPRHPRFSRVPLFVSVLLARRCNSIPQGNALFEVSSDPWHRLSRLSHIAGSIIIIVIIIVTIVSFTPPITV